MKARKPFKPLALINRIFEVLSAAVLAVMVILGAVQIFLRYVVGSSLFWSEEIMTYLFIWLVFFGAILATRRNAHPFVDILINAFGERSRLLFFAVRDALFVVYAGVLIFQGAKLVILANSLTPALLMPYRWIYLSLPVGAFFIAVFSVANFVDHVTQFRQYSTPTGG
jgi:TRAP-type C4-dicarboxylate transport system permease small subunit